MARYLDEAERAPERAPALLDELCREHPRQAEALRRRVRGLVASGLWEPDSSHERRSPQRMGRYRLLRELGRGGMGTVFLASDDSAGKRVALKVLHHASLFQGDARERFRREALAVARLDHPGIVGVLAVDEADGVPYLAMEFAAGLPLSAVVDALRRLAPQARSEGVADALHRAFEQALGAEDPAQEWNAAFFARPWVEVALRIVRDVAQALHHAHQRGVVHRDVKPSNVVLAPSGRVRLLDFGLAALSDVDSITHSGVQIGSLPYMSPEQIDGRSREVDARSDVYSLGVLLYELLCLDLPYHGANFEELRGRVLEARTPSLRARNPSVSADVETVCFTALERDPARRYASADELARDVESLLSLRPIQARPPSLKRRVVRFTQRRPALASSIVLGALLVVAGPLGYALSQHRSLERVRAARDSAERSYHAALEAVGHVLRDSASVELEDVPRMQTARLALIDRARELLDGIARERPEDPALWRERALVARARAEVLRDMGRHEEALQEHRAAVDDLRRTLARSPDDSLRTQLAAALDALGKNYHGLWRTDEAWPCFEEADEILEPVCARHPENVEWGTLRARTLLNVAESGRMADVRERMVAGIRAAVGLAGALAQAHPADADVQWTLARALDERAQLESVDGEFLASLTTLDEARAHFAEAAALEPQSRFYEYDAANVLLLRAQALRALGRLDEAERDLDGAQSSMEALLRDYPQSDRYFETWASTLEERGWLDMLRRRFGPSKAILARAVSEREEHVRRNPADPQRILNLAATLNNAGSVLAEEALDPAAALDLYERALQQFERLPHAMFEHSAHSVRFLSRYGRGLALCRLGELSDATGQAEEVDADARDAREWRYAADLWCELALALGRAAVAGRAAPAGALENARDRNLAALARALQSGYADWEELAGNGALRDLGDARVEDLVSKARRNPAQASRGS